MRNQSMRFDEGRRIARKIRRSRHPFEVNVERKNSNNRITVVARFSLDRKKER